MEKETSSLGAPIGAFPRVLVIDRSRWLRGEGGNSQLLRSSDHKMCCLGFLGLDCGYPESRLTGEADPVEMHSGEDPESSLWPQWLAAHGETDYGSPVLRSTPACSALITTNDAPTTPESLRETEIVRLFAEHGVEVRFVDGNAPEGRPQGIQPSSRGTP